MLIHWACDNDIHPPLFGATQRVFGLARGMATRADVRALCVVPNRSRGAREERVQGVEIRRVKSWHTSLAWRLERAGLAPLFVAEGGHRARAARYREALGGRPDALLCDLSLAGMFAGSREVLRAYHAHNVESERWRSSAPRVWRSGYWGTKLAELERRAVAESDLAIACAADDAALLRSVHGAHDVLVVANGYDETALAPATPAQRAAARRALGIPDDAYVAAFVGGDWAPNHEAVAWLVQHVMPRLARENVVLLVVGAVASRLRDRQEPWLRAHAQTPDLASILAAADCGLNPVTSGGGSNVKVPTYLAMGLAVVSTSFGLRGYAPLADQVTSAERAVTADALRAKPLGWAARREPAPARLADHAWGTLGARLADALGSRRAGRGAALPAGEGLVAGAAHQEESA